MRNSFLTSIRLLIKTILLFSFTLFPRDTINININHEKRLSSVIGPDRHNTEIWQCVWYCAITSSSIHILPEKCIITVEFDYVFQCSFQITVIIPSTTDCYLVHQLILQRTHRLYSFIVLSTITASHLPAIARVTTKYYNSCFVS